MLNGSGCGKFSADLLPEGELYFCQLNAVIADSVGLHKCVVKLSGFFLRNSNTSLSFSLIE